MASSSSERDEELIIDDERRGIVTSSSMAAPSSTGNIPMPGSQPQNNSLFSDSRAAAVASALTSDPFSSASERPSTNRRNNAAAGAPAASRLRTTPPTTNDSQTLFPSSAASIPVASGVLGAAPGDSLSTQAMLAFSEPFGGPPSSSQAGVPLTANNTNTTGATRLRTGNSQRQDLGGNHSVIHASNVMRKNLVADPESSFNLTGTQNTPQRPSNGNPLSTLVATSSATAPLETVSVIWGTDIELGRTQEIFSDFLRVFTLNHVRIHSGSMDLDDNLDAYYPRLLEQIRLSEIYHLSLDISHLEAYPRTQDLVSQLIAYPQEIIPIMDDCVAKLYEELFPADEFIPTIQVRPFNVPNVVNMRELDPNDIDKLVAIKGIVIRSSSIIPDMRSAFFKCIVCNHSVTVENDRGKIEEPTRCPRDGCGVPLSMTLVHNRCVFSDKQIIKLQETPGQTPHTVTLMVYDSMVDIVRPGDRIEVTGIFRTNPVRVNPRQRTVKSLFRTFIDVVHIRKRVDSKTFNPRSNDADLTGADYLTGFQDARLDEMHQSIKHIVDEVSALPNLYETLASSLAPSIYGLEDVKKGLLLQLFGGETKVFDQLNSTGRFRGDIHILMAGDPGVSKSQLLQYVHKLAPRGMYTSGKGSSAVGLTAYITRDPETKQVVLESGALVLSDGGICCIDEFDKMSDTTRAILHEAMEQQTVSIAKRGIIASLNARTSILASANPIDSKYNSHLSIVQNLNLPPTLLSRFDLIYLLLDRPNEINDLRLAKHLVQLYLANPGERRGRENVLASNKLSLYISYVRENIHPKLTDSASQIILDSYVKMRRVNGAAQGTVSATTRQLESIIRLSEAHAKMRCSELVEDADALEAVRLIKEALMSYATDPSTGRIDMDLVNTGKSAASRDLLDRLKKQIQNVFKSETSLEFSNLLMMLQKSATIPVSFGQVHEAVDSLDAEGFLQCTGNPKKGRCVLRKLAAARVAE